MGRGSGGRRRVVLVAGGDLSEDGWHADAGGAEDGHGESGHGVAHGEALVVLLDFRLPDGPEVLLDVVPACRDFGLFQMVEQRLLERQGEEGAEQVAADGGGGLVKDGSGVEDGLGGWNVRSTIHNCL